GTLGPAEEDAEARARREGYDEILLVDADGCVAEGPTTNLFLVEADGSLCTPPEDTVLLGVTRSAILEIAKHEGIDVRLEGVRPERLKGAAEVFLTGTTAGVWPVGSIDDHTIGDGGIGPVSRSLRERFARITAGEDADFQHWLTFVDEA
ncbi:MAG: aminotransferase class IV, partial [Myxococcota bacterium]